MGISRLLLSLGVFALSTVAWKLDESCGPREGDLGTHLRASFEDAFDVVSGALTELQKPQRTPEVNRLLELLFAPKGQTGDQYDVRHLVATFQGIGSTSQEVTAPGKYEDMNDFVSIHSSTTQQQKGGFAYAVRRSFSATEIVSRKRKGSGGTRTLKTGCR